MELITVARPRHFINERRHFRNEDSIKARHLAKRGISGDLIFSGGLGPSQNPPVKIPLITQKTQRQGIGDTVF